MSRASAGLAAVAALALVASGCAALGRSGLAPADRAAALDDGQLIGQRLVVGFGGERPPRSLRRLIRSGGVAGVILFERNFDTAAEARSLIGQLQRIPRPGPVDYPLLVMADQEGGAVTRLPGAPAASAAQMGAAGEETCRLQGAATARLLRATGVNVDLAPVLDVARPGSAIAAEGRSFGADPDTVGACAAGFADALADGGVAPTAKHFPGLGAATINTDYAVQRITLGRKELRGVDERPYAPFIGAGAPLRLVMLSSAIYTAFGDHPASLTPELASAELRGRLGFEGVSITDALDTVSTAAFGGPVVAGDAAVGAGVDLLLFTAPGPAQRTTRALRARLPGQRDAFEASAARVLALRAALR